MKLTIFKFNDTICNVMQEVPNSSFDYFSRPPAGVAPEQPFVDTLDVGTPMPHIDVEAALAPGIDIQVLHEAIGAVLIGVSTRIGDKTLADDASRLFNVTPEMLAAQHKRGLATEQAIDDIGINSEEGAEDGHTGDATIIRAAFGKRDAGRHNDRRAA
jgi:hypothetical protein